MTSFVGEAFLASWPISPEHSCLNKSERVKAYSVRYVYTLRGSSYPIRRLLNMSYNFRSNSAISQYTLANQVKFLTEICPEAYNIVSSDQSIVRELRDLTLSSRLADVPLGEPSCLLPSRDGGIPVKLNDYVMRVKDEYLVLSSDTFTNFFIKASAPQPISYTSLAMDQVSHIVQSNEKILEDSKLSSSSSETIRRSITYKRLDELKSHLASWRELNEDIVRAYERISRLSHLFSSPSPQLDCEIQGHEKVIQSSRAKVAECKMGIWKLLGGGLVYVLSGDVL